MSVTEVMARIEQIRTLVAAPAAQATAPQPTAVTTAAQGAFAQQLQAAMGTPQATTATGQVAASLPAAAAPAATTGMPAGWPASQTGAAVPVTAATTAPATAVATTAPALTAPAPAPPATPAVTTPAPAPAASAPATTSRDDGAVPPALVPLIRQAAQANGLEPALVAAVARAESGFDPDSTSSAGAQGLMQLMPGTARAMGVTDPMDPAQSLMGGARYLRGLLDRFNGDRSLALAGYNAGPNAVARAGGIPDYPETQAYVPRVTSYYQAYRASGL